MLLGSVTILGAVLLALVQHNLKRLLALHAVSQVGYMAMGLALQTRLALAGTIFYLIHHIFVKANLFLVSGVVQRLQGSFELAQLGGIYRSNGKIAMLFFIPAFSLAGFPPLSGFWAKMILIRASLDTGHFLLAGVAAVVGCDSPKVTQDQGHLDLVLELLKRDVLVAQTGCSAIVCGKAGLLRPEAAKEYAGPGLQEICEAVGIPPVLHVGSCVDNSRLLTVCAEMVREGGVGKDFTELPVAAAAPGWWSATTIFTRSPTRSAASSSSPRPPRCGGSPSRSPRA